MATEGKSPARPRLRFPEFREGADWNTEPMGKLYSFIRTNALSRDKLNYDRGTVKNIHYGDIHTKLPALLDITKEHVPYVNHTEELPDTDSAEYCAERDIILADASEDMNDVGKSIEIVRLNDERLLSGQHTILARPNDDRLVVGFGGHLFQSERIRSQIRKEAQGTKVYAISSSRLTNIKIAYPRDPHEQEKIRDCLTSVDEVVAGQRRKVEALKVHKRGLVQLLFPGEDETLPRLRFPEFRHRPKWTSGPIGTIAEVFPGYGFPERLQGRLSEEYPFYKVSDISAAADKGQRYINDAKNYVSKAVVYELRAKPLPRGTTIFAKIGEAIRSNKRAITTKPSLIDNNAAGLKGIPGKASDLFVYYLWSNISLAEHSGGVVPSVNKTAIEAVPIVYPEPDEQHRIAECLSSLDILITAESEKLGGLMEHKKGLMQRLFPWPE
jgi:type I restriction enzyme S subunit